MGNLDGVLNLSRQYGIVAGKDLSDDSQAHIIASDSVVGLYGVAQEWWRSDGTKMAELDPTASGTGVLFGAGPDVDSADYQFKILPDGTCWLSTLGISGAFHQELGRWAGTRGLVIEPGTTNYCLAPRMIESGSTGRAAGWGYYDNFGSGGNATEDVVEHPITERGWLQRLTYTATSGDSGDYLLFRDNTGAGTFAQNDYVTLSVDIKGEYSGVNVQLRVAEYDSGNSYLTQHTSGALSITPELQRLSFTTQLTDASCDYIQVGLYITSVDDGESFDVWFGAVNVEKANYATSFCCGALGWCSWSGTVDDSTSARTVTEVNLDAHTDWWDGEEGSFAFWVQMPYDYDADWPTHGSNTIMNLVLYSTNNIYVTYNSADQNFRFYPSGGSTTMEGPLSFSASDWVYIVAVFDNNTPAHKLFVNGVLADTVESDVGTKLADQWNIGSYWDGGYVGGFVFSEVAVFGRALTDSEVAAIYHRGQPLYDGGAIDKPGVYILDGRFSLATAFDDARIEFDPTGFWVYDEDGDEALGVSLTDNLSWGGFSDVDKGDIVLGNNASGSSAILWDRSAGTFGFYGNANSTVQVEIDTNGRLTAGGGTVRLDENDIQITSGSYDENKLRYVISGTSTVVGSIDTGAPSAATAEMNIHSNASVQSSIAIRSQVGGAIQAQLRIGSDYVAFVGKGLGINYTGTTVAAGDLYTSNDIRVGGGICVGSTSVDPNSEQIHFGSATYRLRRNGTHIEWYNGSSWVQLD